MARICFLGTPEESAVCLRALVAAGHEVALVVTGKEARRGRRAVPSSTPVRALAEALLLPTTSELGDVTRAEAELGVVVAYGRLIPVGVLEALPMVNVHFSLLPRWRGAAPVERAILAGDEETGVSLMRVEEGLDTGAIYASRSTPIGPDETAAELRARLAELGAALLVEQLASGLGVPRAQSGVASYAAKLSPGELRLDFTAAALFLVRLVRVGRAWTTFRGRRLLVHRAHALPGDSTGYPPGTLTRAGVATGEGWFVPEVVQESGRGRLAFTAWQQGARLQDGEMLGASPPETSG